MKSEQTFETKHIKIAFALGALTVLFLECVAALLVLVSWAARHHP